MMPMVVIPNGEPIMSLFACPHCGDVVEFLGEARDPECDCGAILEPFEPEDQADPDLAGRELRDWPTAIARA